MFLDLSKIHGHDRVERRFEPSAFAGAAESFQVVAPVALAFDVDRDGRRLRLLGRVGTNLKLVCGRCLEPFVSPVDAAFELMYLPQAVNAGEGEVEIGHGDLTSAFYENDEIDLGQLVREQLYLSLPMKPLCTDSCRGLCPHCGVNLNRGECGCTETWEDPRLVPLRSLLNRKV